MTLPDLWTRLIELATNVVVITFAVVVLYQLVTGLITQRLDLQPFEPSGEEASGLMEIVRSELLQLQDEGAGSSAFFTIGPDLPLNLPSEIAVTPLNFLQQLVKLLPSRTLRVVGRMQPESVNGYGVTLTLTGSFGRTRRSTTIWESTLRLPRDLPTTIDPKLAKQERHQRLAIAAAAWVAYGLLQEMPASARTPLLSQDWKSYVVFRVGAEMQRQKARDDIVRAMYQSALRIDPHNRGALFNVGWMYLLDGAHYQARQALEACVHEIETAYGANTEDWRTDRLWYRAKFNAGAVCVNEQAARDARATNAAPGAAFSDGDAASLLGWAKADFKRVAEVADGMIQELAGSPSADPPAQTGSSEAQPPTTLAELGRYAEFVQFLTEVRSISLAAYQATLATGLGR